MCKIINRYSAVFLLTLAMCNCIITGTVYGAVEEAPPEQESPEKYGVLAVECSDTRGTVTVSSAYGTESFVYDYYEMIVPVEQEVNVTVSPDACYTVKEVSLDKIPLEETDGSYTAVITDSFMTMNIVYEKIPDSDTGNGSDVVIENPIKTSPSEMENSSSENSVGCISDEVTVIYLDNDETADTENVPPEDGANVGPQVTETDSSTPAGSTADDVTVPTDNALKRASQEKAASVPKDSVDKPASPSAPGAETPDTDIEDMPDNQLSASLDANTNKKTVHTVAANKSPEIQLKNDDPIRLLTGLGLYILILLLMTGIHIIRIILRNVI